jgi:hypothetical protein
MRDIRGYKLKRLRKHFVVLALFGVATFRAGLALSRGRYTLSEFVIHELLIGLVYLVLFGGLFLILRLFNRNR